MFTITGITGKVGGAVAEIMLRDRRPVRAVARDKAKAERWAAKGCEPCVADLGDAESLTRAFREAEGVFLMTPPNYDPQPGFPDTRANAAAIRAAIEAARPKRVVFLSTVGAQVTEPNLLNNSGLTEEMLRSVSVPVCLLRAAWFMENAAWDVADARKGAIQSFLQPVTHAIPMVSVRDIARVAAERLQSRWSGLEVIELEGPRRYSAADVGAAFSRALGTEIAVEAIPRESWDAIFRQQGARNPQPRIRMLDGFNEGWIEFEGGSTQHLAGAVTLEDVISELAKAAA